MPPADIYKNLLRLHWIYRSMWGTRSSKWLRLPTQLWLRHALFIFQDIIFIVLVQQILCEFFLCISWFFLVCCKWQYFHKFKYFIALKLCFLMNFIILLGFLLCFRIFCVLLYECRWHFFFSNLPIFYLVLLNLLKRSFSINTFLFAL